MPVDNTPATTGCLGGKKCVFPYELVNDCLVLGEIAHKAENFAVAHQLHGGARLLCKHTLTTSQVTVKLRSVKQIGHIDNSLSK